MPVADNRKTIEIPKSLWEALNTVGKRQDLPTGALAAIWLWEHLELKAREPGGPAEGVHAPQPYHQASILPRRNQHPSDDEEFAEFAKELRRQIDASRAG